MSSQSRAGIVDVIVGFKDSAGRGRAEGPGRLFHHIITDRSIDFIRRNKDNPFFLYVAHQSVHNFYQIPSDPPELYYRDIPL